MNPELKNLNLVYRKLKISDYNKFKILFYLCFNKKISFKFFKWRYFSNKFSFCYGAFEKSSLIANVGMVSKKLNNNKLERVFSRHSSMVLKKYRGLGIFSTLLKKVKKKISNNVRIVITWPNKNNFSNFGVKEKDIIKKKYYLYKTTKTASFQKNIKSHNINELNKLKYFIKNNNSFFLKNFDYYKKRYLSYQKQDYIINKFIFNNLTSFFILKCNKDSFDKNYVVLDHFGCQKIKSKHLSYLIKEQNNLIFLSKNKINKSNLKLLNFLNFKILFVNKLRFKQKKIIMRNKEIFLGDTDIFIKIGKV